MRRTRLLLLLIALAASGGCDIPTAVPVWDTEWELLLARDSVPVEDLLPEDVEIGPQGFRVASFESRDSVRLDEVCELCTCFDGPIPELSLEAQDYAFELPDRLLEAPITRGTAILELTNGLGFDLLDDGLGGRGFIRADLVDGRTGDTLVSRTWTEGFPEGSTVTLTFPLDQILLHRSIVARVTGTTPGSRCDDLVLDPSDGLDVRVELRDVEAPSARVLLNEADLAPPTRRAALPAAIADRLRPGEADLVVSLDVSSSLGLAVDLELSVAASAADLHAAAAALTTPVRIAAGADGASTRLERDYVVDPSLLVGRDSLIVSSRTRLTQGRSVTVTGPEILVYDVRLRARVPSR
jgi:hypothetical protein